MDFTVPNEVNPETDLMLTRLARDFHEGYLTEKGYIKKRMEILGTNQTEDFQSVSNSTSLHPSVTSRSDNQAVSETTKSNSVSDHVQDDFFRPSHTFTNSIDGSSNTQPVFYDDEMMSKYNNLYSNHDQNIRKELQKPLDPRDVASHIEPKRSSDNLAMILRKRAKLSEKEPAVLVLDERGRESKVITWDKLYYRAEKIAQQIKNKAALYPGDRVCLIYQNVEIIDFMVALYGCFLSGVVAVPLSSSTPTKDLITIMNNTQSHLCLMSDTVFKYFEKQGKQTKSTLWPKGMVVWKTTDMGTYKPSKSGGNPALKISDLAYIDFTKNSTGEYKGVVISHQTILHQMEMLDKILSTSPDVNTPLVRSTLKISSPNNSLMSTLDVRNSIGLTMSMLFSVYSGNLLVWLHRTVAEVPGLFANAISSYRTSILLTDYYILRSVVFNYQSFPQNTRTFSKRKVNLSCVKWCLIDTYTIDCEFNEILSDRWFKPLGNRHSKRIISPILSLHEQGGAIVSMRDWYGHQEQLGCILDKNGELETLDEFGDDDLKDKLSELLIDKDSLSTNSVKIINSLPPPYSSYTNTTEDTNYVRVCAFGYPLPDTTLAIVNPETKTLSGVMEVGEIWADSNCISGGYWGLPEDTENIFQAECSDYEGILSLKFVRTGLLGFIYNGQVFVLGLYEDRINQRVTWYDQYLEISADEKENKHDSLKTHSRNVSTNSDIDSYYKAQKKKKLYNLNAIDLSQNLSNKYIYKYHYSNQMIKTLARNLPYFKDCAFFNLKVNKEYLPVAVMESDLTKDASQAGLVELQSMLNQAFTLLEKHHNVRLFFIVATRSGALARSMKNGRMEIANTLTKRRFLEGRLPSVYVSFKPYNSLGSIYHGDDLSGGIWSPYSTSIRKELLCYSGYQSSGLDERNSSVDDRSHANLADFENPMKLLEFRASKQSDELAFVQIEGVAIKENKQLSTWKKLESKVFSICSYILEKSVLKSGDAVILCFPLSEEYIACLFACWLAGFTVIPLAPFERSGQIVDENATTFVSLIKEFKVQAIFVNNDTESIIKNKPFSSKVKVLAAQKGVIVPKLRNTSKHSKTTSSGKSTYKKMEQYCKNKRSAALKNPYTVWVYVSPDNIHTCVKVTFSKMMSMCLSLKETCQMSSLTPLLGCARFCYGLGFLLSSVMGVYLGTTTYLMTESEYESHTSTFYQALERYRIQNVHLESTMFISALRKNSLQKINLIDVKNLILTWEEKRADPLILIKYKERMELSNIKAKVVSNVFSHPLNPFITTRSFLSFEPVILWLDPHGLSQGYISIVNPKDSPNAIPIVDSGIVSVNTEVIIVNPQTEELCKIGEFGEIWVSSGSTADGYAGYDDTKDKIEYLNGRLSIRDKKYLRTGKFGFLHSVNKTLERNKVAELQLLFNLGNIDETFEYCGLQFFSYDIEHCMETFEGISKSCVFKAGEYTVLVVATDTKRSLSTITPLMILKLLNKFKFVVDIISFVDPGGLPTSSTGVVQRRIISSKWINRSLKITATYGVSYGENEMIKAVNMQDWVEERLSKLM